MFAKICCIICEGRRGTEFDLELIKSRLIFQIVPTNVIYGTRVQYSPLQDVLRNMSFSVYNKCRIIHPPSFQSQSAPTLGNHEISLPLYTLNTNQTPRPQFSISLPPTDSKTTPTYKRVPHLNILEPDRVLHVAYNIHQLPTQNRAWATICWTDASGEMVGSDIVHETITATEWNGEVQGSVRNSLRKRIWDIVMNVLGNQRDCLWRVVFVTMGSLDKRDIDGKCVSLILSFASLSNRNLINQKQIGTYFSKRN